MSGIIQSCVPGARPKEQCQTSPGSVDGFPFFIEQPDNTDYLLAYDWPSGGRIAQLRITSQLGYGVCTALINGIAVEGISGVPIAANSRSQHSASGKNSFGPGDDIYLRIDSGAGSLVGVKGTLVITNKSAFAPIRELPSGLVTDELAITGGLVGAQVIPLVISPPLRRNPIHIFPASFVKNSPTEDNIYNLAIEPIEPNDYTGGWNYRLNGPAVEGQVMRYAFIK